MTARFSLGIDLGTSNCAMALTDLDADRPEIVPIPQILAANQLGEKPTLGSAVPAASGGIPVGVVRPALGRQRRATDRRAVRPRPWRARARSPGDVGQILAVEPAHRSEAAHASLEV